MLWLVDVDLMILSHIYLLLILICVKITVPLLVSKHLAKGLQFASRCLYKRIS